MPASSTPCLKLGTKYFFLAVSCNRSQHMLYNEEQLCLLEAKVDEVLAKTDGLENLGGAVAGKQGDTNLAHDLEEAAVDTLPVVLERSLDGDVGDLATLHLGLSLGGVVP
jgi:hypothetical protein